MKDMDKRNLAGFALLLVSVGLLIPGLMSNLLTLRASFSVPILGNMEVLKETRSILGTIGSLAENGHSFVAFLILLFSVLVPFAKALIMGFVALSPSRSATARLYAFVGLISKWSMADVFVVGIFIAFLSIKTNENIHAELHEGFYYFTAYCITSILAVQIIHVPKSPPREILAGQ
jgi:paraquat-inducible protein A